MPALLFPFPSPALGRVLSQLPPPQEGRRGTTMPVLLLPFRSPSLSRFCETLVGIGVDGEDLLPELLLEL